MLELLRTFICNKRVLLIHHFVVPLSRCGSVTLGLLREPLSRATGMSFTPLAPLRYLLGKATQTGLYVVPFHRESDERHKSGRGVL